MDRLSRRRLLAAVSAGAVAGVTGCNFPDPGSGVGGAATRDCTEELAGEIAEDRTLDCDSYEVTGDLTVAAGATLEVVSGATLSFAPGTGLAVAPGGTLRAAGTEDAPVTFTADREEAGTWRGIEYAPPDGGTGDLHLEHALVEYAGDGNRAAVDVTATTPSGAASVTDTLVQECSGTGVRIGEGAGVDAFERNRITGNGGVPVECSATVATDLAADNELVGNGDDAVVLRAATIEDAHTWRSLGVPYRVRRTPTVAGHLTIDPGTTVEFARDQSLRVVESGALTAVGESGSPVTFTGWVRDPGHWAGLWFEETAREENRLENAVVEYGGSVPPTFAEAGGNVVVDGESPETAGSIAVENTTLRASGTNGFAFGPGTDLRSFAGNELVGNRGHPGRLSPDAAGVVDPDTVFEDNREEGIAVRGARIPGGTTIRWAALETPYRVVGDLEVWGGLEVAPGATVEFDGSGVFATGEGILAVGGGEERTELVGADGPPGAWIGVWIARDATGRFENAVIEGAGATPPPFEGDPSAAGLAVGRLAPNVGQSPGEKGGHDGEDEDGDGDDDDGPPTPTLVLDDVVVSRSRADGLYLGEGTTVERVRDLAVVENEGNPATVHASVLSALGGDVTFRDNGDPAVAVRGGGDELVADGERTVLESLGTAYRFFGSTLVRGELVVEPGATLEFGADADLRVLDGGTLTAEGTDDETVEFRGASATTGHWRGILVRDSTATFEHATILHGGGGKRPLPDASFRANVAVTTSDFRKRATLELTDVRIGGSDAYALYIGHFTTVDPEDVRIGLARKTHNAESLDHEPHPRGSGGVHDED